MKELNNRVTDKKKFQTVDSRLKYLRIADVELFITAAHMKNLGKSAAFHHLSQSAASTAVQRVEAAFGVPLCTHEKRQFRLTSEGEALFHRLEDWVKMLQTLAVSEHQMPIRLVATHAIAQIAVPALLPMMQIDFKHQRPDDAYRAICEGTADIAIVLDNAPWKGVITEEVGRGSFQLYSKDQDAKLKPVLLPEDQREVLSLQQSWQTVHGYPLPTKSRIPSWSLIANICAQSEEVGFLPEFLARQVGLYPVSWNPQGAPYRILAIYRNQESKLQKRLEYLLLKLRDVFGPTALK